jgi:hypothetical protein
MGKRKPTKSKEKYNKNRRAMVKVERSSNFRTIGTQSLLDESIICPEDLLIVAVMRNSNTSKESGESCVQFTDSTKHGLLDLTLKLTQKLKAYIGYKKLFICSEKVYALRSASEDVFQSIQTDTSSLTFQHFFQTIVPKLKCKVMFVTSDTSRIGSNFQNYYLGLPQFNKENMFWLFRGLTEVLAPISQSLKCKIILI